MGYRLKIDGDLARSRWVRVVGAGTPYPSPITASLGICTLAGKASSRPLVSRLLMTTLEVY